MKLAELFLFEVKYHLRRVTTWVFFLTLIAVLLMVADEIVDYAQTIGGVLLNAPLTIADLTGYTDKFGLLMIAAIAGNAAVRDLRARMDPLIFTKPINKYAWLSAKFMAVFLTVVFMLPAATYSSLLAGSYLFKAGSSLFGPSTVGAYLYPFLILTLPNAFTVTAILFAVVLFTRNSLAAFMGGFLLFLISSLSMNFGWETGKLLDPFGINIVHSVRLTATPSESNTALLPVMPFIVNRIIWIAVSLVILSVSFKSFKFTHYHCNKKGFKIFQPGVNKEKQPGVDKGLKKRQVVKSGNKKSGFEQICYLGWFFFKENFRSRLIIIFSGLLVFFVLFIVFLNKGPLQYPVLPTTERITLLLAHPSVELITIVFITFFSGHLIWRERDARLNEINDALPVKDRILMLGKFLALGLFIITILLLQAFAGILVQLLMQYHEVQPGLYLVNAFVYQLTRFVLFAALAMAVHVVLNQKYISYLVIVLLYVFSALPEKFGVEHKLLQFNSGPDFIQSVFYGRKEYFMHWLVFKLYWLGWVLLAITTAMILWVRGKENRTVGIKERYRRLLQMPVVFLFPLSLVLIPGGVIFYNTNIASGYLSNKDKIHKKVRYEQLYSKYKNAEQPHLTGIELVAELFPEDQSAVIKGTYTLKNSCLSAIDSIHVVTVPGITTGNIRFRGQARKVLDDKNLNYSVFVLEEPVKPGDSIQLDFNLIHKESGFASDQFGSIAIENGTWIKSWEWLPAIGYQENNELVSRSLRRKYKLPEKNDYPELNSKEAAWSRKGNERIRYTATIGTNKNEIPVTTGIPVKSWTVNGRHYNKYDSEQQVLNMFYINSSNYEIRSSTWNDVELSIYHHPRHTLNLDTIEQAMKMSLEYYSRQFSPYPLKALKFVETPDPGTGGISLPGYIGYSSNFALLNPVKEERGFNLPFAVAAHEIAHQWWPHQLIPANVEGAAFLTEGLAWYSAFGVIEKQYGTKHLANLLNAMRKEFLNPRSKADRPLMKATDEFHGYRKGPFAMYALREYAGEESINRALKNLIQEFGSGEPPYVTMLDFYDQMERVIPDSLHYLLYDLIAENTYWNLAIETAEAEKKINEVWELKMTVHAKKVYVDTEGKELEASMSDWAEIGVYNKENKLIYLQKHKLISGKNSIRLQLNEKPAKAGVDPRHLLIDADPENNLKPFTIE